MSDCLWYKVKVKLKLKVKVKVKVNLKVKVKVKQASTGQEGSRKLRFPDFATTAQDGGRLSVSRTGRLYPLEILLIFISVRGLWYKDRR
jgi:hypothetical protein